MDLFESGVFGQNTPAWHGKGDVVPATFSYSDIFPEDGSLGLGGINWDVETRELFDQYGNPVTTGQGVFRLTDNVNLGTVGTRYKVIQNRKIFSFLAELMNDRVARWEAAISIKGGRTVAGIVSLPDSEFEIVKGDSHFLYLAVVTSHDGSGCAITFPTDVRIVCANTVAAAVGSRRRDLTTYVRHSGDINAKLSEGQRILKVTTEEFKRFMQWQQELAQTPAPKDKVDEVINLMFPETAKNQDGKGKTQRENKIAGLLAAVDTEVKAAPDMTAYTLFNGFTRFADHTVGGNKKDRAEYALVGGGQDFKQDAIKAISQVFDVKRPAAEVE